MPSAQPFSGRARGAESDDADGHAVGSGSMTLLAEVARRRLDQSPRCTPRQVPRTRAHDPLRPSARPRRRASPLALPPARLDGRRAASERRRRRRSTAPPFPVTIRVDASRPLGELKPIWRFFGADEPNYATMKDGRKLIGELGRFARSRSTSARTTCSTPATARRRSSGEARTSTPRTPRVAPCTTGRCSTGSSTRTSRAACGRTRRSASCRKALSTNPEPYQHEWRPGLRYDRDHHGLGVSAEGLRKVGRAHLPMGEALRRAIWPRRGRAVVLGGVERAESPGVLARLTRGVLQAARLRGGGGASRAADGARRWPRRRRDRGARSWTASSATS